VQLTTGNKVILIVDDTPEILRVLRMSFLNSSLLPVCVSSGNDAKLYIDHGYDFALYVIDVLMPGCDGIELASLIRARSKSPIIFISGAGGTGGQIEEVLEMVRKPWANTWSVPKPFKLNELMEVVDEAIKTCYGPDAHVNWET
jgi:DNA-binding NtrC family response regulator